MSKRTKSELKQSEKIIKSLSTGAYFVDFHASGLVLTNKNEAATRYFDTAVYRSSIACMEADLHTLKLAYKKFQWVAVDAEEVAA